MGMAMAGQWQINIYIEFEYKCSEWRNLKVVKNNNQASRFVVP